MTAADGAALHFRGPRLVEACGIEANQRVLDVAAGTGNASIPAAEKGAIEEN